MNPDYPRQPTCNCGTETTAHDATCDLSLNAMAELVASAKIPAEPPSKLVMRPKRKRIPKRFMPKLKKVKKAVPRPTFTPKTLEQRLADGVWMSHNELRKLKRAQG